MSGESLIISERIRITREAYPTVDVLREAALKGIYNPQVQYFSRGFLWKSVLLNSYDPDIINELIPIPGTETNNSKPYAIDHIKHNLDKTPTADDPLSTISNLADSSGVDILDIIRLDVTRLLIDPIFNDVEIQSDIIEILYTYSAKQFPYKQGFHELCGLIYLQLHKDIDPKYQTENRVNTKLETYAVFTHLMATVTPIFYKEENLINWCQSVFNYYLSLIDPSLYELLVKRHRIESQIWLIRWVRLLFLRELGIDNTVRLLDFLICYDTDIGRLIPFIIIICLIKVKINLVECEDNGEVLQLLLRYPVGNMGESEIKELIDLSAQIQETPEAELELMGRALNMKFNKSVNWEIVRDLDRLRMELRLQRRVKRALKRGSK